MGDEKKEIFSLSIDPEIKANLDRISSELGYSRSHFIELAIESFCCNREKLNTSIRKDTEGKLKVLKNLDLPEKRTSIKKKKKIKKRRK